MIKDFSFSCMLLKEDGEGVIQNVQALCRCQGYSI